MTAKEFTKVKEMVLTKTRQIVVENDRGDFVSSRLSRIAALGRFVGYCEALVDYKITSKKQDEDLRQVFQDLSTEFGIE